MRRTALLLAGLGLAPAAAPGAAHAGPRLPGIDPATVRACFAQGKGAVPACIGAAAKACVARPGGETTVGMTHCADQEAKAWDHILNAQYSRTRTRLRTQGGPALVARLRAAQRAWIGFRDADCRLTYEIWKQGTIAAVLSVNCVLEKTAQRAFALRGMGSME